MWSFLLALLLGPIRPTFDALAYNYCDNKSHPCDVANMKHFICHEDELKPLDGFAQYVATVPDTPLLHKMIVNYHNDYRNRLASGELVTNSNKTFKAASRMRLLIWDIELAYMARVHSQTVSFKHSQCRSCTRFPMAGENLGFMADSTKHSVDHMVGLMLNVMFEEYLLAEDPDDLIQSFDSEKHYEMGHFTVIANERVSRVGCGISTGTHCSRDSPSNEYCHFLTCHYDFTNVAQEYLYEPGDATSSCDFWKASASSEYSHLCSNTGEIFPTTHGPKNMEIEEESSRHLRHLNTVSLI